MNVSAPQHRMIPAAKLVRDKDGTERVLVGLADFQALVDAASAAEPGGLDVKDVIRALRAALDSNEGYVDAGEFLEQYDAAHGSG
jgi:hypothetical protein